MAVGTPGPLDRGQQRRAAEFDGILAAIGLHTGGRHRACIGLVGGLVKALAYARRRPPLAGAHPLANRVVLHLIT